LIDMGNILVVDDILFWREVIGDLLRQHSHAVTMAADSADALAVLKGRGADLVVLDVEMAHAGGLSLLEQIRREPKWKDLPVIILTGDVYKEHVLLAKKLGAVDYLLKSRFSPPELLERIQRRLESSPASAPAAQVRPAEPQKTSSDTIGPGAVANGNPDAMPELLTREKTLARAAHAMSGRTLAGVVAEVIASANSPKMNLSDLTALVARDGMLSARVLHAAKSAANVSVHGISTLSDAVRVVGCRTVGNIAAAIGIFDAMPQPEADGFSPIRTWQHSLVVAKLCERLAPANLKPSAYLAGLCHELGLILFRTHFGPEYRQVLEAQKASGQPLHRVEIQILGATHGEVSEEILKCLGLPEHISRPINLFHHAARTNAPPTDPLAKVLRMADAYASGILLASSEDVMVSAFTQAECRDTTGRLNPLRPNDAELRQEIRSLTLAYARVSPDDQRAASAPLFPREPAKLLVVRDPELSAFDPITAALEAIAQVTVAAQLPTADELGDFQGLVVIARTGTTISEVQGVVANSPAGALPVLFLTGKKNPRPTITPAHICVQQWPISIADLAKFAAVVQLPRYGASKAA
jgi:CheY-like chemotaxis protein/HD-like signal output (HDOD) protein